MSFIRELAKQIVAAHRHDNLCLPLPSFDPSNPPPVIKTESGQDQYELAGTIAAGSRAAFSARSFLVRRPTLPSDKTAIK